MAFAAEPVSAHAARRVGLPALSLAVGAAFAVPFGYLAVDAIRHRSDTWDFIARRSTLAPLWRSVQLGVVVTLATTVLGVAMAWFTTRTDVPLRRLWTVAAVLPLVIPSFVGAQAFISTFARGGLLDDAFGIDTGWQIRGLGWVSVVLTLLSFPYVYLPVAARMAGLPPSLEETSRLLGRRTLSTFVTVVLPQCAAAIASGALLVLLYCLSEYGAVSFIQYDALTVRIFENKLNPVASTAYSLLLGLAALAVAGGERLARRRLPMAATVSTRRPVHHRLGRWRAAATAFVAGVVLVSLVAPVSVLTWWVVRGRSAGARRSKVVDLRSQTWSSAWVAIVAAVIAVAVTMPVAWAAARRRSRTGGAASAVVMAAFALPGIVIALAVVRMFRGSSLYQQFPLLIAAYVLHFGGQALGVSSAAIVALPTRYEDAARLLGASRWRRWWRVELPLLAPGLAAAGGLVMLSVLKELPATLLLSPLGFDTLATRVSFAMEDALLVDAGELSLVLLGLSGVLTWLLVVRRLAWRAPDERRSLP